MNTVHSTFSTRVSYWKDKKKKKNKWCYKFHSIQYLQEMN